MDREIGDQLAVARDLGAFALLGDRAAAIVHAKAALKIYEAIGAPQAAKAREWLAKWQEEERKNPPA